MSTLEADLMQTERQGDDPPADAAPPAAEPPAETPEATPDAEDLLEIPDSSAPTGKVGYVPLAAIQGARQEIKALRSELNDAKTTASRSTQLEAKIAELEGTLQQYGPVVQAYHAMVAQQPPKAAEPAPDTREAEAFARNLDLYTSDGTPDIAKAQAILDVVDRRASAKADASVQPLAAHTVSQASQSMLRNALHTTAPDGSQPHPDDLRAVWNRLDPAVTATKEGAIQVWIQALGISQLAGRAVRATAAAGAPTTTAASTRTASGQFAAPLHSERAGGKEGRDMPTLSEAEKRYIKAEGISEADYLKSEPAWMRR